MQIADISNVMNEYLNKHEILGCSLMVRKNDQLVYQNKWGYADVNKETPIEYNSMYRYMSMTKCVVCVAIMKLIEDGMLELDDKVSKYIPEYAHLRVAADSRYVYDKNHKLSHKKWKQFTFSMKRVKTVPADREITIRDLLSHASGLEQGCVGRLAYMKMKPTDRNLEERIQRYAKYALGFQPGTGTDYSVVAGFDVLGYIIQKVSGMTFGEYLKENIFDPLGMNDTCFFMNEEQQERLVCLYKKIDESFIDVSGSKEDNIYAMRQGKYRFECGCGGLYGTITDYEKFARMLCNDGSYEGGQLLKPSSVHLIHTEAQEQHLEPNPGMVWGLSVKIRQNPEKAKSFAHKGTYGWTGAFGTHYFVCPNMKIEAVFMTNRSNFGGSGSPILKKVEELVFDIWGDS